MSQPWDYIAKLVCIGDSGTGKSSLTIRLCEGRFSPHHDVTIGVEFGSRIVPVGPPASLSLPPLPLSTVATTPPLTTTTTTTTPNPSSTSPQPTNLGLPPIPLKPPPPPTQKHMKLSLWDTAGQETYKSVTRSYFRGASGALLVFDITRRPTFTHAVSWLADLRQIAEDGIVIVLVGNKSDLVTAEGGREVSAKEARMWCEENGVMSYVETSAKSGEGVERAFREVAERIYGNIAKGRYDLNDRRSGVKGPGGGGAGRAVRLEVNGRHGGFGGGCC